MAFRAAYGARDSIEHAIKSGKIPKECIIFTRDSEKTSEAFIHTPQGELKEVVYKNKFNSLEEANAWITKYDCVGNIISIKDVVDEEETVAAYIVKPDNTIEPVAGEEHIIERTTVFEFPTIGKPNRIYIATNENDGHGAVYRWDSTDEKYYKPESTIIESLEEGAILNGGGAFG